MPKKIQKKKVCRNCKAILLPNIIQCPYCGSKDFSEEFSGFIIIINPENSEISKRKNLKPGIWAIKIF
ncbi:MAG: transcription elongation factor subunit Spt4 [Candidatus Aenigmatarchaeota archaeon]